MKNFSETKNFHFNHLSDERLSGEEHFHIKNYLLEITPLHGKMRSKTPPQKHNFLKAKAI